MNIKLDIPENFYYGEERCGYYVSPEMKRVWAVELDLIAEFARVCEKYNIKWYADSGTLLGAARHKGFIPWDDDVDLAVMREDYNKLLDVADKEFKQPYALITAKTHERGRLLSFAKLCNEETTIIEGRTRLLMDSGIKNLNFSQGIFIDIFPLDNIPDDREAALKFINKSDKFSLKTEKILKLTDLYIPSPNLLKRPMKYIISRLLSKYDYGHKTLAKFIDIITSYKDFNSEYVAKLVCLWEADFLSRMVLERSEFDNPVYLSFETLNIPAPSGWEKILNKYYGDWHKYYIRERHGNFYDTEHSYKYYTEEGHPIDK
ncbi:MAG: LicD family protein [Synergistaceae bacterium]|nr:LicD family protein [Synergistaceae bacterium]